MNNIRKVEIYSIDFEPKDFFLIDPNDYEIDWDYVTLSSSTVTSTKSLNIDCGDYIFCKDVFSGIVDSIEENEGLFDISFIPLYSIFDVTLRIRDDFLEGISLIQGFALIVRQNFINPDEETQKIPYMRVQENFDFGDIDYGARLVLEDNICNLWELFLQAFNKYRLVCEIDFSPPEQKFVVTIRLSNKTQTIIAKPPHILSVDVLIKPESLVNMLVAYWDGHPEADPFRIKKDYNQKHSKIQTESITADTEDGFKLAAADKADELFAYDNSDNNITITTVKNSFFNNLFFGDIGEIKHDGKTYNAMLTQITDEGGQRKLVFGNIRANLTDILKQKR